jgi:hypothetical protein
MYYVIYEVKNKVNGKTYIGKHQTNDIYDDYLGSGKYLKRAINKYGKDCFEKVILYVFDNKKEMDDKEEELVNEEYVKNKNTYNLKKGGQGGWDHIYNNPDIMTKVAKKGYNSGIVFLTKEERLKNTMKGYKNGLSLYVNSDDPVIKKQRSEISSNSFRGKRHTNETKEKIGKANSIHQQGEKNSQFGTCWIYNNVESIRIDKNDLDEYLQQGWNKGRKIKF